MPSSIDQSMIYGEQWLSPTKSIKNASRFDQIYRFSAQQSKLLTVKCFPYFLRSTDRLVHSVISMIKASWGKFDLCDLFCNMQILGWHKPWHWLKGIIYVCAEFVILLLFCNCRFLKTWAPPKKTKKQTKTRSKRTPGC